MPPDIKVMKVTTFSVERDYTGIEGWNILRVIGMFVVFVPLFLWYPKFE